MFFNVHPWGEVPLWCRSYSEVHFAHCVSRGNQLSYWIIADCQEGNLIWRGQEGKQTQMCSKVRKPSLNYWSKVFTLVTGCNLMLLLYMNLFDIFVSMLRLRHTNKAAEAWIISRKIKKKLKKQTKKSAFLRVRWRNTQIPLLALATIALRIS